jgi:hypothetical protein
MLSRQVKLLVDAVVRPSTRSEVPGKEQQKLTVADLAMAGRGSAGCRAVALVRALLRTTGLMRRQTALVKSGASISLRTDGGGARSHSCNLSDILSRFPKANLMALSVFPSTKSTKRALSLSSPLAGEWQARLSVRKPHFVTRKMTAAARIGYNRSRRSP